jgi:hypothetical protein
MRMRMTKKKKAKNQVEEKYVKINRNVLLKDQFQNQAETKAKNLRLIIREHLKSL